MSWIAALHKYNFGGNVWAIPRKNVENNGPYRKVKRLQEEIKLKDTPEGVKLTATREKRMEAAAKARKGRVTKGTVRDLINKLEKRDIYANF